MEQVCFSYIVVQLIELRTSVALYHFTVIYCVGYLIRLHYLPSCRWRVITFLFESRVLHDKPWLVKLGKMPVLNSKCDNILMICPNSVPSCRVCPDVYIWASQHIHFPPMQHCYFTQMCHTIPYHAKCFVPLKHILCLSLCDYFVIQTSLTSTCKTTSLHQQAMEWRVVSLPLFISPDWPVRA